MALYIDPPVWPAHGTVFSHLISDSSLEQLHRFAAEVQLSERAFDRDHYDVPAHRHAELIARGAQAVEGRQLARILNSCGLRVPAIERPEKVLHALRSAWARLLPGSEDLGEDLLARWSQPHRHYHSPAHLASVLRGIARLERAGELAVVVSDGQAAQLDHQRAVRLAAWFHDAVYDGVPGADERASAQLARDALCDRVPQPEAEEVARLVLLTQSHSAASGDPTAGVLCDADLEVLARERAAYQRYIQAVRQDYAHVPDAAFRKGRAAVLESLLAKPALYSTTVGRQLWEAAARKNMTAELDDLGSVGTPAL